MIILTVWAQGLTCFSIVLVQSAESMVRRRPEESSLFSRKYDSLERATHIDNRMNSPILVSPLIIKIVSLRYTPTPT